MARLDSRRHLEVLASSIRDRFPDNDYIAFHSKRYAFVLSLLDRLLKETRAPILDVGRSALSDLVHERFSVDVDSLGFGADGPTPSGRHFQFDLNSAQESSRWRRDVPRYEFVVLAEVIEHLHTSPALVLRFLQSLMRPGGKLIIQTPNAAALHKRLRLLLGSNPFELIREDPTDPGHFREYTVKELIQYARDCGLHVGRVWFESYFDYRFPHDERKETGSGPIVRSLTNGIYPYLPSTLRPGITLLLVNKSAASMGV